MYLHGRVSGYFPFELFFIFIVLCGIAGGNKLIAGNFASFASSPNRLAAEKALEAAKTAADPIPSLQEALRYLNKVLSNAGGYRDRAIAKVKEAIELARQADTDHMKEKIDSAIFDLNAGMSRGGRVN